MLPPIEPDIASANPKFDALYRDLCSNKLNEDGTTQVDANAQKERDAFSEDLQKARVSAAKSSLIMTHLQELAYREDELPVELRELVTIITATLNAQLNAEDTNLLRPDVELFKENIHPITTALSNSVSQDLSSLAQILSASSPCTPQNLLPSIHKLKTSIATSTTTLSTLRLELPHETTSLLALYRTALEISIQTLEQPIHGSLSRATKSKAEYLSTVAEGMSLKLQLQQHQLSSMIASPEMEEALRARAEELERETVALKRKVREKREVLEEYESGEGGVEGMAREYARILGEAEKVKGDIERLESNV